MKIIKIVLLGLFGLYGCEQVHAQKFMLASPDKKIAVSIDNSGTLSYSVTFQGRSIVNTSTLGFELLNEPAMKGDFMLLEQKEVTIHDLWKPVIKSKNAEILNHCNELQLSLKEKSGLMRRMDLTFRAYNDGVALRYKLYGSEKIGDRKITRELTSFNIPDDPNAWIVNYGGYASAQESEFFKKKLSALQDTSIAGIPFLMEFDKNCWVAITEANIDNYSGFYIGKNQASNQLMTRLAPLPGESADGTKVAFDKEIYTPWRVLMIGDSPGVLIESEIVQNLNEPCQIEDPSWIKPGTSAWDNWWSGDVKMEMPVIKQYIDFAAEMGWEYMLVDWQWYGTFNTPLADITKAAPQIDMEEVIAYAKSKNVRILLWLYSSDVNRNSAYKEAFPLYKKWGVAGVKIDFMDRDDQQMVNWYREIIKCAADNQLLVNFHGAYKPDGIIRTYPNMITREGVMGNEFHKFTSKMSAAHNVKLAFTRMLAGQMDYTPGGFLNVTEQQFKNQTPTIVPNTRAAELSKFVIYESPLTVVCEHPDNLLNKPGADFLKIVPTVWDNTHFIGGHPEEYIALARQNQDTWYLGVMNNSTRKAIDVKLDFLGDGVYEMEIWADTKKSDTLPTELQKKKISVKKGDVIKIDLAINGGYVATLSKKK
ncbi:glycoside hydrolase family 97 protein [Sphingobacterium deserti]|uniref:Alpha-glucosidase n=1 Tax=Sphingobacterium deserti TaxID=1229276 RepID=A0A0B8T6Q7_9SPHI|nr:glycoside hydrolase family 97 protein [Sphingobacterium deserti]KGE13809.1 alpha-glucosidase [Sphingobacterium deserti]